MNGVKNVSEEVVVEVGRAPLVPDDLQDAEHQVQVVKDGCNEKQKRKRDEKRIRGKRGIKLRV